MTKIEWTEETWNPMVGCSVISPGCKNCYAMREAGRKAANPKTPAYAGTVHQPKGPGTKFVWTGVINRNSEKAFRKPLMATSPTMYFVNSMSDFFHENADPAVQAEAWAIMAQTPQHTYQVLTKRPENVAPFLKRVGQTKPLPNVWIGASVENCDTLHRINTLRNVKAAVRFLSLEPLLEDLGEVDFTGIHWVIIGGESGPNARPMRAEWVYSLVNQAKAQHVAVFMKQWGAYSNNPLTLKHGDQVKFMDSHGKGGALVRGKLLREMPNVVYDPVKSDPVPQTAPAPETLGSVEKAAIVVHCEDKVVVAIGHRLVVLSKNLKQVITVTDDLTTALLGGQQSDRITYSPQDAVTEKAKIDRQIADGTFTKKQGAAHKAWITMRTVQGA